MSESKSVKPRKCKVCGNEYTPKRPLQRVDTPKCALEWSRQVGRRNGLERQQKERKERREGLEKLKTRRDWLKDAQTVFNAFIRERDKNEPCISCKRWHQGQYHAGHYRTTKAAPELRFNENNVHRQCAPCNNNLSGNILEYRIGLIQKLGKEAVEALEGKHEPKNYTIDDLKQIIATYQAKLKALKTISDGW
jgi:hypothetical protein